MLEILTQQNEKRKIRQLPQIMWESHESCLTTCAAFVKSTQSLAGVSLCPQFLLNTADTLTLTQIFAHAAVRSNFVQSVKHVEEQLWIDP